MNILLHNILFLILFVCHYQFNFLFGSTRERGLDHRNHRLSPAARCALHKWFLLFSFKCWQLWVRSWKGLCL